MSKEKREVLMKARPSRKTYIPFYTMAILLLGLLGYLHYIGKDISWYVLAGVGIFIILGINLTETHRMDSKFEIEKSSVICTYGIFNKTVRKIDFFAISDVYVSQTFWQWILGHGNLKIKLFSDENATEIKNINKPSKFSDIIEKQIIKVRQIEG